MTKLTATTITTLMTLAFVSSASADVYEHVGEVGTATRFQSSADQWHPVQLDAEYENPVVLMQIATNMDEASSHIRVRNVQSDSFEFKIEEWDDGVHFIEAIDYVVIERGTHVLTDGTEIKAFVIQADSNWRNYNYTYPTSKPRVVISQVQTAYESDAIVTRHRSVGTDRFEYRLQESEADDDVHGVESVGFLVVEPKFPSSEVVTGVIPGITHEWMDLDYPEIYPRRPYLLAAMQTFNGPDPAAVRIDNATGTGFSLRIEEESLANAETNHTQEDVGVVGFLGDEAGALIARGGYWNCLQSEWATIEYGTGPSEEWDVETIVNDRCIGLDMGSRTLWTTYDEAGGVTCPGIYLYVNFHTASDAFPGFYMKNHAPAACDPDMVCPDTAPPEASGSVSVWHSNQEDMETAQILGLENECYKVNLNGTELWFPTSALEYRCDIMDHPAAVDYDARMTGPC